MTFEPKSIAEHIECLARLTGAPALFVGQVRNLFSQKGISLFADAAPYIHALEEAFRREEQIRAHASALRPQSTRDDAPSRPSASSYQRQLEQMNRVPSRLRRQGRRLSRPAGDSSSVEVTISGDHRSFVTRRETENLPMVPGPKDPQ